MATHLKKLLLTFAVAILFALYAYRERSQSVAVDPKSSTYRLPPAFIVRVTPNTSTQAEPYLDGTYTGSEENAVWGSVMVVARVTDGILTDVEFTEYPHHRVQSQEINNGAMPELIEEAIQIQSADVDIVTGATDTSMAFIWSLESALEQAMP